jgi:phospholipid/cholesterol/gamma-HCH transport system substrate-binding protein
LAKSVPPAVTDLSAQTPPLTDAFKVLTYTVNELAYNPGGANQGFLYWLAWFAHNANSAFSTGDAHGSVVRGLVMGSCQTFAQVGALGDVFKLLFGDASGCSPGGGG